MSGQPIEPDPPEVALAVEPPISALVDAAEPHVGHVTLLDESPALGALLAAKLHQDDRVAAAAYKTGHQLEERPYIYLTLHVHRTSDGAPVASPLAVLASAVRRTRAALPAVGVVAV
jgi:DNA-directed RNA polymerase subunit L